MDPLVRIALLALGIVFLIAYYGWRWRRAGAYVERMEQYQERGKANFLALKAHPKTQELMARIAERHRASFEPATDPQGYQVVWLALLDDRATCYRVEDIGRATMLVAYLLRETDPKQVMVSLTFATGEVHDTIPPYGWTLQAPI